MGEAWESGKKNADVVFEELLELQSDKMIPDHWMNMGVENEENEEIKEKKKPIKTEIAQNPELTKYSNKDNKDYDKKETKFNTAVQDMQNMLDNAQQKGVDAAAKATKKS